MSLKCPFCGKEYFHDSKMCQTCEDKSKINKIASETYTYIHYKYTTAFGRRKILRKDKIRVYDSYE